MGKLFHLTTIRERRVLTPVGWVTLSIAFGFLLISIILFIHPFLAPTKPVGGDILVVEGWLPDYALKKAKERFQQGNYQLLVTTGGEIGAGYHLSEFKTWAEIAASTLKNLDFPEDKIMITRTWKNHPIIPQSKNFSYNPFQWVNDFEKEVLENNRKIFSIFYNTDIEEHWLKSDND